MWVTHSPQILCVDMFTQSLILFGIRNSKLLGTKTFVKNDMLSLVYTPAKCLLKMLCVIIESSYTRGRPHQTLQISRLMFHTADKKSFAFPSPKKVMPQVKDGKVCRTCVSVERGGEDNVNTLGLSTLIWWDFTTLSHCK